MSSKVQLDISLRTSAAVLIMLATQGIAHAQTADASATQTQDDDVVLSDIVVTGSRGFGADTVQVGTFRNARIMDVPLTVNVVPEALLQAQAAESLFDGLRNTAGVSRAQTNGVTFDNVTIRGIRAENRTSYRLNGALPVINLVDLPIENKERLEALKGVGAVYYGFGPPSGIINMVTKRANVDVSKIAFAANSFGGFQTTVDIGRKIGDNFGLRFNGAAGVVEPGIDRFSGSRYVAALAADARLSDAISVRFDVEHVRKDVTEPGVIQLNTANSPLTPPATVGRRILPPRPPAELNLGGKQLRADAQATNILGRVDVKLSDQFALTLEAGRAETTRDRDAGVLRNLDLRPGLATFGVGSLVISRARNQNYVNRNVRAELAGAFETGPLVHNIIFGTSINWREQNGSSSPSVTVSQNFFNPVDVFLPEPTSATLSPLKIRDLGAYVTDRITIGPVNLIGGFRYSDYDSRTVAVSGAVTEFKIKKTTPILGAVFNVNKDISLYTSYLQGLEETPPAPLTSANAFEVLSPSVSNQYEFGVKYAPRNGLLLQLGAFQIERASAFVDPADNVFKLAGREKYKGIEASLSGELSKAISLALSGQYLDAKVTTAVPVTLVGKTPENTAKWTGSAFVEAHPDSWGGFAVGAGAFYTSSRAVNPLNEAFVPAYTVFNAMIRYEFKMNDQTVALQLNAENVTDLDYWSGTGNNQVAVGLPRSLKLTLRFGL